jgi:hypothetical protein
LEVEEAEVLPHNLQDFLELGWLEMVASEAVAEERFLQMLELLELVEELQ